MSTETWAVGSRWKTRDGKCATVLVYDAELALPLVCKIGRVTKSYHATGKCFVGRDPDADDLVCRWIHDDEIGGVVAGGVYETRAGDRAYVHYILPDAAGAKFPVIGVVVRKDSGRPMARCWGLDGKTAACEGDEANFIRRVD